ncbi:hypothetical protein ABT298_07880 [Streptomyces sp. NPDC001034]|uniref:hypothetical protein n=1 Tax=Streptomyces sp. NPDC001034 TaxID=3154375 RepID=UPI00331BB394
MTTTPLDQFPEDVRAQLLELLKSDDMEAFKLRVEAVAKQQEASALLDQADRIDYAAKLKAAVAELEQPKEQAAQEEKRLEAALTNAIRDERDAEDRARDAAENARQAADAEKRAAKNHADAATQTEALLRARAAADVASRARATAEGATTHRRSVESQLDAARQVTVRAEERYELAAQVADNPPHVPASEWTLTLDGVRRLLMGTQLTESDRGIVSLFVRDASRKLGLDREFANAALAKREQEVEARANSMLLPKPGHPLRPANVRL